MKANTSNRILQLVLILALATSACQVRAGNIPVSQAPIPSEPLAQTSPTATLAGMMTETSDSTPASTPTTEPTPTATLSVPASPTPMPTPSYPAYHYISPISGHSQTYDLGCEASAAVDWAGYFGISIYEYTFQVSLPHSDNPDYGFVGNVNSVWGQIPPYAYGVYAGPVAEVLRAFGLPATAMRGMTLDEVKQNLAEDKPIIVWVIGNMEYSEPLTYTDSQGRQSLVAPYEHVVILTGFNEDGLRYMNNGRFFDVPTDVFLTSWGVLGNMAVIHD